MPHIELEKKYGFPLFTRPDNTVYLGNSKKLIISDIWAFWDYIIKKNGQHKEFMTSLLEQAKNFYIAAETSPVKSKPLLYYYSFLNLGKILVNLERNYGGTGQSYLHGVSQNHHSRFSLSTLTIVEKKAHVRNVSAELIEVLDHTLVPTAITVNVKDFLSHCVGIHRAYSEIYNMDEIFVRLGPICLYRDLKQLGIKSEVNTDATTANTLRVLGYNIVLEEGKYYWKEEITIARYSATRTDYFNLSMHLRNKGLWYFIGNDGYTLYLSTHNTCRHSPEVIIYNAMFYLGSITRYHPYMFDRIFSDKEQWLMSEFLETQPKQFLYLSTAKILGQNVLKAYASF